MGSPAHTLAVRENAASRASVLVSVGTLAIAALALGSLAPATPAFAAGGGIVGWGDDQRGVLNMPAGLTDIVQLSTDQGYALALHADGTVTGWGTNAFSDADLQNQSMSPVVVPSGLGDVVQVVAGGGHALFLRSNGTVVATGRTDSGQTPVPAGLSNVVQLASVGQHTVALLADGTVTAWGWNAWGQLDIPAGLTDVVQIAAGVHHGLALHRDGTITGWGNEEYGQATPPDGLGTAVYIAASPWHSMAILADGTVVEWGQQVPRPGQGVGMPPAIQVAAGLNNRVALHADGTFTLWGLGEEGQLDVPDGLTGVTQVAVGRYHLLALSDPDAARLTISGDRVPGATLTAELSNWRGSAGAVDYQWYIDGMAVNGATEASYTLTEDDASSRVLVRALSTAAGAEPLLSAALPVTAGSIDDGATDSPGGSAEDGADEGGGDATLPIVIGGVAALLVAGVVVAVILASRRRKAATSR